MSDDIDRIVEILEEQEEPTPNTENSESTASAPNILAGPVCLMCQQENPTELHVVKECEYIDKPITSVFSEPLSDELLALFNIEDENLAISVGFMKHLVRGILSRQEKINTLYQIRFAKLAARSVGGGAESISDVKWSEL